LAEPDDAVKSVVRAIEVLLSLKDGPQSLATISERTGIAKPTAHRLLATLFHGQLVIQNPVTSDYQLGPGCLGIANAVLHGAAGVGLAARSTLVRVSDETQETVALHILAGLQRVCVLQIPSPQPVRYESAVGVPKPIYTGAMGKVLLAFMSDDDRAELFSHLTLAPMTRNTRTDRKQLEGELRQIRRQGWSTSRSEHTEGVAAVSAPVFDAHGRILAALSIIGPATRLTEATMARFRPGIVKAAEEISTALGRRG
jgi:IclR family acetate operon transcriptional repressor